MDLRSRLIGQRGIDMGADNRLLSARGCCWRLRFLCHLWIWNIWGGERRERERERETSNDPGGDPFWFCKKLWRWGRERSIGKICRGDFPTPYSFTGYGALYWYSITVIMPPSGSYSSTGTNERSYRIAKMRFEEA
jgi:hypothetical protein